MSGKKAQTKSIAFGGVICGLAVAVMFLSGLIPSMEYSLPAIAGILMIPMVIEYGYKRALLCYLAVAVLSLLLVPNKEAAAFFTGFFGYYPILKGKLEQLHSRLLEWLLKVLIFNAAIVLSALAAVRLLGVGQLFEEYEVLGKWSLVIVLIVGNAVFIFFDYLLTGLIGAYYSRLKPKFLDKLNLH